MVNKKWWLLSVWFGYHSQLLALNGEKKTHYQLIFFGLVFRLISIGMAVRSVLRIGWLFLSHNEFTWNRRRFLLSISQDCITEEWLSFSHRIIVQSVTFSGKFGPNAYIETEIKPPLSLYFFIFYISTMERSS